MKAIPIATHVRASNKRLAEWLLSAPVGACFDGQVPVMGIEYGDPADRKSEVGFLRWPIVTDDAARARSGSRP